MDKVVYVVSDMHVGPGKLPDGEKWHPLEDFIYDGSFAAFLSQIGRSSRPVELVIAGDFLEYPQTLPEIGLRPRDDKLGATQAESIERSKVMLGQSRGTALGHAEVFRALRRFMTQGHSVTIIAGNHDIDLLWDDNWDLIFDAIYPPGASGELRLLPFSYTLGSGSHGRVYIEHGHEHDPANRFGDEMRDPFARDRKGRVYLKRCWGTLFVDKVYNELEQARWFIDNVKPIPRVIKLGLRHDFRFTATALALITRFLLTSGLPPNDDGLLGGAAEAPDAAPKAAPKAEEVVKALNDRELRAVLAKQIQSDPQFKAEFERAMRGMDGAEWGMAEAGVVPQMVLETAGNEPAGGDLLGGDGAEDDYRRAARAVLEREPSISTVIMGHTHVPIDGFVNPIDLPGNRQGYYFNSGTWTRHLKDESERPYTWAEIGDEQNYTASFTYIKLQPDGAGGYKPTMHSWAAELLQLLAARRGGTRSGLK